MTKIFSILITFFVFLCGVPASASTQLPATVSLDAHDGHILRVGDIYYLYGTSYDCGFKPADASTPFCGFNVYSSTDLVNWTFQKRMFDPSTYQKRCADGSFGCYRMDVVYNPTDHTYVAWFNISSNPGYDVLTSQSPLGPWNWRPHPVLPFYFNPPGTKLVAGDEDVFTQGTNAYLTYTAISQEYNIHELIVDKLNSAWTGTTEDFVHTGITGSEAPSMTEHDHNYYMLYSATCFYCNHAVLSYATASNPLGSWTEQGQISSNTCGGQNAFLLHAGGLEVLGADLWDDGAHNEAAAREYLTPLEYSGSTIETLSCTNANPPG